MGSVYKLQVHRCAANVGCNALILATAQFAAANTGRLVEVLHQLRQGKLDELLPARLPIDQWVSLYSEHRRVMMCVADHFPHLLGNGSKTLARLDQYRAISTMVRTDPKAFAALIERRGEAWLMRLFSTGRNLGLRQYRRHLQALEADFSGVGDDANGPDFGTRLKESPELLFYFRVVLPCLCVYQTHPASLLRKARRATNEQQRAQAIERLVRIDPMMAHEPSVVEWCHGSDSGTVRKARMEQIDHWCRTGLDGRFSSMQVYASIGGLIWGLVESFGLYIDSKRQKLRKPSITAEQIRQLFYAVEEDRRRLGGKGRLGADTPSVALPALDDLTLDGWRKAIYRQRKLWGPLLKNPGAGQKSP